MCVRSKAGKQRQAAGVTVVTEELFLVVVV
jgi:hypothetical protein